MKKLHPAIKKITFVPAPKRHIRTMHPNPTSAQQAGDKTICGAPSTKRDVHFNDGMKSWVFKPAVTSSGVDAVPCDACRKIQTEATDDQRN